MGLTIRLEAVTDKLNAKLWELETKESKKGAKRATREAAKVVLRYAKSNVPVDSGALKKSLKVKAMKRSRKRKDQVGSSVITGIDTMKAFVGDQFYGQFIEFGWTLRDGSEEPPRPFLRPALWDNKVEIHRAYLRALRDWLKEQEVKKAKIK